MKIIIVSDNHGNATALKEIRARHLKEADLFLHCGDSQLLYDDPLMSGFLRVAGNCDYDRKYPKELIEALTEGYILFMAHGHLYGIKMSMNDLRNRALELGANIVCYGHSHCVHVEVIDNILFINPGSVVFPRNTKERTYACFTIKQSLLLIEIFDVENGTILRHYKFER